MLFVGKDEGFVYLQVAYVRGSTIVGAMDSQELEVICTRFRQKGTLVKEKFSGLYIKWYVNSAGDWVTRVNVFLKTCC